MMIIPFYLVFIIGLYSCCKTSKQAWLASKELALPPFDQVILKVKAAVPLLLSFCALCGLLQAALEVL
ncbi:MULTISPECIES: hypothetical protein [Acinetobacter]|uniref:Uncharacterized protein n=1 Tax=Acinetobacter baumannii TaxID=470 RepID=A0AAP1AGR2_ACIBA|nr:MULTISPECIES: hypothetical protein [Acinetobacter]AIL81057.1 hypothetical protein IX87_21300 [Acinetobacter baumannii]AIS06798.1 hypothetical protein LX00_10515 [Acinetobacter baumannii]APJ19233.1 hypothetical protein BS064_09035 [Acinetobacter baumannii]ATD21506.1 hypothetical protein BS098_17010 [Acinetobacter baumannii]AVE55559.1 hypothetical protein AM442_13620 [Acinetobacter baumannii]